MSTDILRVASVLAEMSFTDMVILSQHLHGAFEDDISTCSLTQDSLAHSLAGWAVNYVEEYFEDGEE